jgi:hypothetical protein
MCYDTKCSEKEALSGYIIKFLIKTLTSKSGKRLFPIKITKIERTKMSENKKIGENKKI